MGMTRAEARQEAQTILANMGAFESVVQGVPDLFAGRSPVAVITSRSIRLAQNTHGTIEVTSGITVSIYVLRGDDGEATEDQLDDLVTRAAHAFYASEVLYIDESQADPAQGNLRDVDRNGQLYRVERIPLTVFKDSASR